MMNTNKKYVRLVLGLAILLVIPIQGFAATPKETIKAGVDNLLKTLGDPSFKAKPKDEKIALLGTQIEAVFDFTELSKRTLGRTWKKMSSEQQTEFVELFQKLLQGVYADLLISYTDEKIIFGKETMLKKGRAEVESYLQTKDGKKIPLFYRLTDKSGSWKVYDVIIEGVSMVKNYRTQFREIMKGGSPEKLLEILRKKVEKG
jgi:phospholipid transport system substrate-binding protein